MMVAETRIPGPNGVMVMTGNGVAPVVMVEYKECEFELILYQPAVNQPPTVLEIRVGDEFLATGRLVMTS